MNIKEIANKRQELLNEYRRLIVNDALTSEELRDFFESFIESEEREYDNGSNIKG
jgi:hypothetical protein